MAESLGIALYDKEIIKKVAERSGLSEETIEQKGEYNTNSFLEIMAKVEKDACIEIISGGTFLCRQINLNTDMKLADVINAVYGSSKK